MKTTILTLVAAMSFANVSEARSIKRFGTAHCENRVEGSKHYKGFNVDVDYDAATSEAKMTIVPICIVCRVIPEVLIGTYEFVGTNFIVTAKDENGGATLDIALESFAPTRIHPGYFSRQDVNGMDLGGKEMTCKMN